VHAIQTGRCTCGNLYLLSLLYVRRVGIKDKPTGMRPAVARAGSGAVFIIRAVVLHGYVVFSGLDRRDPVFAAIIRGRRGVALVILILSQHAHLVFRVNDRMTHGIAVLVQYTSRYHAERQHLHNGVGSTPAFTSTILPIPPPVMR
jgi:hypothetical protein